MDSTTATRSSNTMSILVSLFAICLTACAPARAQVALFTDDFDAGNSAGNWVLFTHAGDYTADFAFDYSTRGIPPAPNSAGGTTIGLHFTVNNNDATPAADAVSAYPIGVVLAGSRVLKFDMWMNYNGGAGGGTGSTEFATFGIDHAGTQVVWANNANSDGFWFACSGEGGDADDYRAYRNASLFAVTPGGYAAGSRNHTAAFYQTLFPSPTYETAGAPGKHWVEVEISQRAGAIEWRLNGMLVAFRYDTTLTTGNLMLGYMDTYASIANPAADNFVIFDNVRVEGPDCNENNTPDDIDLSSGTSLDCNADGRPDECETIPFGDFDVDGDVDFDDFAIDADCLGGPGVPPIPNAPNCMSACLAAFDFDSDQSIDLRDFAAFQPEATLGAIPPRATGAPLGSQFMAEAATLTQTAREVRVQDEITGGNIPGFLRTFVPVNVSAVIGGNTVNATFYVMPDYLCIGRDDDFARIPMTPLIAQPIADAFECLLPTRKMVNAIYSAATVKLAPVPISPATVDIMLATTFYRHHQIIEGQRAGQPLGLLVGGIKKDVVITPLLASNPGKVAIYGWHQLNGVPIQPLYLGHVDWYVDYSHGIRLVSQTMIVDGVETTVAAVLADPNLCVLLSDEGVVTNPSY
ncbi:MAG TPA: hypothetical protein PLP66_04970 [Phycisphaerae bacterium]|nr:hypothetical protein [Phycisphaerae bacterium]